MDYKLKMILFPADVLIKNHIQNDSLSNYELFLAEVVNSSTFFRKKAPAGYRYNYSQSKGEADCISKYYSIDFKLLGSESEFKAKSLLSLQKRTIANGVTVMGPKSNLKEMEAIRLHVALRDYSVDELKMIFKQDMPCRSDEDYLLLHDVKHVLKTALTKKNILWFFSYYFVNEVDEHPQKDNDIREIAASLELCFGSLMRYRDEYCAEFDTYICVVYEDEFLLFDVNDGKFLFVDLVPVSEIESFMHLNKYQYPAHRYMKNWIMG